MTFNIHSIVRLGKVSSIPQDAVENSWSFISTAASDIALATALDDIDTKLIDFYTGVDGTFGGVNGFLGQSISTAAGAHTITHYDVTGHLSGTPAGSPIRTPTTWTTATIGAGNQADELAACLSFHADYTTDVEFGVGTRPRARDRGRVYLGPLDTNAKSEDATTHEAFVSLAARNAFAAAAVRLGADADPGWAVWSRSNAAMSLVVGGWIDNAFDVQRRRGNKATSRTTFVT